MTRLANTNGRLSVIVDDRIVDVETASGGRFGPDPAGAYDDWGNLLEWLRSTSLTATAEAPPREEFGSPTPRPRQIIALGINSRIKLDQFGLEVPTELGFISKLHSALAAPFAPIVLTSARVYAEAEVALVIGARAWHVSESDALSHIAGIAVAADLGDVDAFVEIPSRVEGGRPVVYHNPAKSLPGFAPMGPELVTLDEVADIDRLRLRLGIDGRIVQDGITTDFVFPVAEIIARLSRRVPLLPGDVILTGSPGQLDEHPLAPLQVGSTITPEIVGVGAQSHLIIGT